jgi:hypothetical protein
MDAIKLIPQLFFDVISRVIPGVVALVLVAAAMGSDLGALVTGPFRGAVALQQSALFLGVGVIGASYIAGAMISPVSDFYERYVVGALMPRSFWLLPAALAPGSHLPAPMQRFLVRELGLSEESRGLAAARFRGALFVWYDWLRVWQPQAGSRVEKIRSEYRMFGGVAVGAFAAAFIHLVRALAFGAPLQPLFAIMGLLLFLFASWGMARMFRTFERSVVNQYYVSKEEPVRAEGVPAGAPRE